MQKWSIVAKRFVVNFESKNSASQKKSSEVKEHVIYVTDRIAASADRAGLFRN